MTGKSWYHFALVSVLWGIPYLLMKVAVEDFPPAAVVAGRTLIGASILIPIAIYRKKFGGAVLGFNIAPIDLKLKPVKKAFSIKPPA